MKSHAKACARRSPQNDIIDLLRAHSPKAAQVAKALEDFQKHFHVSNEVLDVARQILGQGPFERRGKYASPESAASAVAYVACEILGVPLTLADVAARAGIPAARFFPLVAQIKENALPLLRLKAAPPA
jgi:transcription initiation factor TFIIIB Brf1 subunit/transcription initiation factor TFIIB